MLTHIHRSFICTLLVLWCGLKTSGQVGTPDPTFGINGIQTATLKTNLSAERPTRILSLPDGRFLVASSLELNTFHGTTVARYLTNGQLDTSFGNKGYSTPVPFKPSDATLQPDGKIVVAGYFETDPSDPSPLPFLIFRLNADGTPDQSFGSSGFQALYTTFDQYNVDRVEKVELQGDKIVVAGFSYNRDNPQNYQFILGRTNPDGSPDSSFGVNGLAKTGLSLQNNVSVTGLLVHGDKILIAGSAILGAPINNFRYLLVRFNIDGSPDTSFGINSQLIMPHHFSSSNFGIAAQGDKFILAGGYASSFAIVRYLKDGTPDPAFGVDGTVLTDFGNVSANAYSAALQGNKIVAVGATNTQGFALARYNEDGSLDQSFGINGIVTRSPGVNIAVYFPHLSLYGDKIRLAATAETVGVPTGLAYDVAVSQYNFDGSNDTGFGDDGLLVSVFPDYRTRFTDAVIQPDGKIITVGRVQLNQHGYLNNYLLLMRFQPDGSLDSSFSNDGIQATPFQNTMDDTTAFVKLQGDKIVVAATTQHPTSARFGVARYNSDGSLDNSFTDGMTIQGFGVNTRSHVTSLTIDGDKIILAGVVERYLGSAFGVARYNFDGSLDKSFDGDGLQVSNLVPQTYEEATAVAMQGDKIVVAGRSYSNTSQGGFRVLRYNADGSLDHTFNSGSGGWDLSGFGNSTEARAILVQNDEVLVAGTTDSRLALASYHNDGTLGTRFADLPGGPFTPTAFTFRDDGVLFVAGVDQAGNNRVILFDKDLIPGPTFQVADKPFQVFNVVPSTTRLYAVGWYNLANSFPFPPIARKAAIAAYQLQVTSSFVCPLDTIVQTKKGNCAAVVNGIDPVLSFTSNLSSIKFSLSGATIATGTGSASGASFNTGITTVSYWLIGDPSVACSFTVTVQDKEPPVISNLYADPYLLWPPNHQMTEILLGYDITDNCGATAGVTVTSNEPQTGTGPGDIGNDWQIFNNNYLKLRAERNGNGTGRIYTITITATDAAGNSTNKQVTVRVPHSIKGLPEIRMKVFPNPTSTYFTAISDTKNLESVNMRVYNNYGVIMETRNNVRLPGSIQFGHNYPPGTYWVEFYTTGLIQKIKLMKLIFENN